MWEDAYDKVLFISVKLFIKYDLLIIFVAIMRINIGNTRELTKKYLTFSFAITDSH